MVNELYHHGVKGMRWGVRRYQNKDGTLTETGMKRNLELHDTKERYIYQLHGNPGLKKAAKAELERGRLFGKTDEENVMGVQKYFVESMEDIADLANTMRELDPEAKDPGFEHAYKYVQKQREAAFRGYMYLASEMSKQAGIYDKPMSDSDLKQYEDLGRRWEKAYDGDMYKFDTQFLPSEMKKKFNL